MAEAKAKKAAEVEEGHVIVKRSPSTSGHIEDLLRSFPSLPSQSLPHLMEKRFFSTRFNSANKRRRYSSPHRSTGSAENSIFNILGEVTKQQEVDEEEDAIAEQTYKDQTERKQAEQRAVVNRIMAEFFMSLFQPKSSSNQQEDDDGDEDREYQIRRKRGSSSPHRAEKRFDTSFLFKSHLKRHEHAGDMVSVLMASRDKRLASEEAAEEVEEAVHQSPLHDRDEGTSRAAVKRSGLKSHHFSRASRRNRAHGESDSSPAETVFDLIPRNPLSVKKRRSGPHSRRSAMKGPMIGQKRSVSRF